MAKKQKSPIKICADCIHESACRAWVDGRYISDSSASRCPNFETVKESAAYLCGVLDERKRKQTNADRIRAMSDEELADFFRMWCHGMEDCADCHLHYEDCPGSFEFSAWIKWLRQPAEKPKEEGT